MMVVKLPYQFRITSINKFTSELFDANGNPKSEAIAIDFSPLNFIDGSGYTVLSNAIEFLAHKGCKLKFVNFNRIDNPAIQYLDDCGFFKKYLKRTLSGGARPRSTTVPCQAISHERGFDWIENRLAPWLSYEFNRPQVELASLRTCAKEVWNNIADHSSVATGFAHAQHYPKMREIKITMSDFGQGIPTTIRNAFGEMHDDEAIVMATREGVTSQSRQNNMGAGLSYLTDTVLFNRGKLRVHSRAGHATFSCDHRGNKVITKKRNAGFYPGTLVEMEFDTRLFIGDEDERGDFEWN